MMTAAQGAKCASSFMPVIGLGRVPSPSRTCYRGDGLIAGILLVVRSESYNSLPLLIWPAGPDDQRSHYYSITPRSGNYQCHCRQERFGFNCTNLRFLIGSRAIRKRGLKMTEANTANTRGVGPKQGLRGLSQGLKSQVCFFVAWWRSWTSPRLMTVPWLPPTSTKLDAGGET